jgi:hypothetical protein
MKIEDLRELIEKARTSKDAFVWNALWMKIARLNNLKTALELWTEYGQYLTNKESETFLKLVRGQKEEINAAKGGSI